MANIRGIILFSKKESELTDDDYSIKRLLDAGRKKSIDLKLLRPDQFEMIVTRDDKKSILIDDKSEPLPDFVIPRLGSNTGYYAFSVIRQLKSFGVYVCNDAQSIYSVKDKLYMHQYLASSRLSTPRTMLAKFPTATSIVKREIGFPLIIKNVTGTDGSGIYLCESEEQFEDVMDLIYSNNNKANIILQEFVNDSYGKDLRVFVIGGKVAGCMQRKSQKGFKANFAKGASVEPFALNPQIEWLSTQAARLFNLDIAGVDLLFGKDGFEICELNSAPGFWGLEKAIGQTIAEDMIDYILIKIGLNLDNV